MLKRDKGDENNGEDSINGGEDSKEFCKDHYGTGEESRDRLRWKMTMHLTKK